MALAGTTSHTLERNEGGQRRRTSEGGGRERGDVGACSGGGASRGRFSPEHYPRVRRLWCLIAVKLQRTTAMKDSHKPLKREERNV
jgi:hypothetical protein